VLHVVLLVLLLKDLTLLLAAQVDLTCQHNYQMPSVHSLAFLLELN
jgi:hypothetical protein